MNEIRVIFESAQKRYRGQNFDRKQGRRNRGFAKNKIGQCKRVGFHALSEAISSKDLLCYDYEQKSRSDNRLSRFTRQNLFFLMANATWLSHASEEGISSKLQPSLKIAQNF